MGSPGQGGELYLGAEREFRGEIRTGQEYFSRGSLTAKASNLFMPNFDGDGKTAQPCTWKEENGNAKEQPSQPPCYSPRKNPDLCLVLG